MLHALLFAAALPAQLQPPPPPPPGPRPEPPFLRQARELGLSEAQVTQLRGLFEARQPTLEPLARALHDSQRALMDCVRGASGGDLAALNQTFAQRHLALMTELRALHQACLAVLSPEQRAKAMTLRPLPPGGPEGGPHSRPGREGQGR